MKDIFKFRKLSNRQVEDALDRLDEEGIAIHSLLVAYKDEVIAERYYAPFKRDELHRMYSVTKSINAIGIGILLKKGLISLDDRLPSIFPSLITEETDERVTRTSIRDLLMMKSPYSKTCYKTGAKNGNNVSTYQKDWVASFFYSKCDHEAGMFFSYDTGAATVLAKIIEVVSGKSYIEFLKEELFSKLSISESTYVLSDPVGNPQGGSGIMMRPLDLLKVIYLLKDGGLGIIDKTYIDEAVAPLSDTTIASLSNMRERRMGYGYQIWCTGDGSYAFVGLGGQFALAVPDRDMVFVTTADTQVYDPYSSLILKTLISLSHTIDPSDEVVPKERRVTSLKTGRTAENGDFSFIMDDNSLDISRVRLHTERSGGLISIIKGGVEESYPFLFGENEEIAIREKTSSPALSSAALNSDGTLSVWIQFIGECQGGLTFEIAMKEDILSMRMRLYGELMFDGYSGVLNGRRA